MTLNTYKITYIDKSEETVKVNHIAPYHSNIVGFGISEEKQDFLFFEQFVLFASLYTVKSIRKIDNDKEMI